MWEAVKTRMSGRAVWEWAAVVVFVGVLASFVVYATNPNPDGYLGIYPIGNGDKHVWGVGETVEYEALCSFECGEYCNAGFTQDAGLSTSSNFNNDNYATASGIKSVTGSGTLSAECPMYGGHGEPTQVFTVVDIDYIDVADTRAEAAGTMVCCYPKEAAGYIEIAATLTPETESSDLRTGFLNWTKTDGTLNFTKVDELNVKVPKTATGYITLTAQAGDEASVWTITIWVLETNLIAIGIDEEDEENPGLFVGVNQYGYLRPNVSPYDLPDTHDVTITWDPELNDKFEIWNEWTSKRVNYNSNNSWDPDEIQNVVMAPPLRFDGLEASSNVRDIELYLQYWDPNYIIHSDTVNVTVVEVDLDAVGISDADESTVGAFVIVNDDDDDEDGTFDKNDTNGITEENDLVALTLQQIKPTDLPGTDYATLSWSTSNINVFESANRADAVTSGDTYLLSVLPKTLYVEGNTAGSSTVELEYCVGTATVSDSVIFTVGTLGMYRDSDCTNVLNDWPKSGVAIRSPKYIFGEEDDIFVKVTGYPGKADNYYDIEVENLGQAGESVNLDMIETSSGIYKNTGTGDALRLSTASTPSGTAEYIKVVDEEILSFIVQVNGVNIGEKSVMVDRGEYAATRMETKKVNPEEFRDEMDESRVNWFRQGYEIWPDDIGDSVTYPTEPMKTFVRYAADTDATHESDFLWFGGHGATNGLVADEDSNQIIIPTDISNNSHWNDDVEWVWIHSCSNLNVSGGGRSAWDDALFGNTRPAHMILGYHGFVSSYIDSRIDDFFDHAAGSPPETIVSAYQNAMTDGLGDEPAAIVLHADNENDMLSVTVTRDTNSTSMKFYWYDQDEDEWYDTSYSSQSAVLQDEAAGVQDSESDIVELRPLVAELVELREQPTGLRHFSRLSGLDVFYKEIPHARAGIQDEEKALDVANSAIKDILGTLPEDAQLNGVGTLWSVAYKHGEPVEGNDALPILRCPKYRHYYNGLPVFGDIIGVSVSEDQVVKIRTCWHRIISEGTVEPRPAFSQAASKVVAEEALLSDLAKVRSSALKYHGGKLGYYPFHDAGKNIKTLLPAWQHLFEVDGVRHCRYVNALDNNVIDFALHIRNAERKVEVE